ncbi:MAG: hypothetical protein LBL49_06230, partial [Clostridiales Family XIII bacterium]|nr:hypothetical protein [Clostridiales Family XIII bacterium]
EDLNELKKLEVKEVGQALEAYNYIIGSPEYRELERVRERVLHDEAQALSNAWESGVRESDGKWRNVVADKDAAITEKEAVIAENQAVIAENQAVIAEKDAVIAEKDAENALLREQLLALQP